MRLIYQDEYGESLLVLETSVIPATGDSVVIADDEYMVKSRQFHHHLDMVVLTLGESAGRSPVVESVNDDRRLAEMNRAILNLNVQQKDLEKRNRRLTDEVSIVRKHINSQLRQERKT